MFDHLFIAEKANLAKTVAAARAKQLGQPIRQVDGVMCVGNDAFTNVSGHFYDNAPAHHYNPEWKSWKWQHLPILPDLKRLPVENKKSALAAIRSLTTKTKLIVNVGDAAREGQLIIDEVLDEFGMDPHGDNVLRLWIQDMTESKIVEYLGTMQPNAKYRDLFESAVARQWADYYLGINMTRAYTIKARQAGSEAMFSVGRVQTPTVRLVVDRCRAIRSFKPVDHYGASILFVHENGSFTAKWVVPENHPKLDDQGRLLDPAVAQAVVDKVKDRMGRIASIETKGKSASPPLPYKLSTLQKECSQKLSMGIDRTQEIAQELYDKYKVASYPRTDFDHLPTELRTKEGPTILSNLAGVPIFAEIAGRANPSLKSPAWDDKKIEDHYAIIPTLGATPQAIAALPSDARAVFDLIAKRFIAQFHPDHRWDATTVKVACEGETFKANGKVVTHVGWKAVYGAAFDEEEDEEEAAVKGGKEADKDGPNQVLPKMEKGDDALAKSAKTTASKTSPPPYFTDATLVIAMENIHLYVTDAESKKKLRETSGLGKSSTRKDIVMKMIEREYVKPSKEKGKTYLKSTRLAEDLIDAIDKRISDPALTAQWEDALDAIAQGKATRERFLDSLKTQISGMVRVVGQSDLKVASSFKPLPGHGEPCGKCGAGKMITKQLKSKQMVLACSAYSGEADGCRNIVFVDDVKPLPGHGQPCPKCGKAKLVTRSYTAPGTKVPRIYLCCENRRKDVQDPCDYVHRDTVDPLPNQGKACPKCGTGTLVTKKVNNDGPHKDRRFYACSTSTYDAKTKKSSGCEFFEFGDPAKAGSGSTGAKRGAGGKGASAGGERRRASTNR